MQTGNSVILVLLLIWFSGVVNGVGITCYGISSLSTTVCSGNGTCIATDTCQCNELATGTRCETPTCYGLAPSDPNVCSGHGICRSTGLCLCNKGYLGMDCSVLRCFQISANTITVCSGRGTCVSPNTCACDDGYAGFSCQFKTDSLACFGKLASDPTICSGNGQCINVDTCSCKDGYSGSDCSVLNCGSYLPTDPKACSGHGSCMNGICSCSSGFSGDSCESYGGSVSSSGAPVIDIFCNEMNASDVSSTGKQCSGHGKCIGNNTCYCESGYYGDNCEIYSCFGLDRDHELVCGGVGVCTSMNQCKCPQNYDGFECERLQCLGTGMNFYNSSYYSQVCSGRGNCTENGCQCQDGYKGLACELISCYGLLQNDSMVCSGHGVCEELDTCKCYSSPQEGFWYGDDCSVCDPFHSDPSFCKQNSTCDVSTCNNLGRCSQDNTSCICSDSRYTGRYCDECNEFHFGFDCETYCDSNVTCNNHGECTRDGFCECFQSASLGFWSNDTCNRCSDGYFGKECRTYVQYWKFVFDKFGYFIYFTIHAPMTILNKIEAQMSQNSDCSNLFDFKNQLPLYCNFSIQSMQYFEGLVTVNLPSDVQIIPGDSILFKILYFEDPASSVVSKIQSFNQDIIPPLPVLTVANSTISYNSLFEIIGSNARNYENHEEKLYYEWSLYTSSLGSSQSIQSLNRSITLLSGINSNAIKISNIPVGNHIIQLRLKNRFNSWSDASQLNITRLSSPDSGIGSYVIPVLEAKILLNSNPFYYTSDLASSATQPFYIKKLITVGGVEVNYPTVKVEWKVLNMSSQAEPLSSYFAISSGNSTNYDLTISKSTTNGYGNYTIYLNVYNITTNELLITTSHNLIFITPLTKITYFQPQVATYSSSSSDFPYKVTLNFPQSSFADKLEAITWECNDDVFPDGSCDSEWISIISSGTNQTSISVPVQVYMRRSRSVRVTIKCQVGNIKFVGYVSVGAFYGLAHSGFSNQYVSTGTSSGIGSWFGFVNPSISHSFYMNKMTTNTWVAPSSVGTLSVYDHLNGDSPIASYSNYLVLDSLYSLKITPSNVPSSIKILKTLRTGTEDGVPMQLDLYIVMETLVPPTISFDYVDITRNLTNGWANIKIDFSAKSRYHQEMYITFNLVISGITIQTAAKNSYQKSVEFAIPQFTVPFDITYTMYYFTLHGAATEGQFVTGVVKSFPAFPLSSNLNTRGFQLRMKYHVDNNFSGDISNLINSANTLFIPVTPAISS